MIIADTDVLVDYLRGGGAAARVRQELATGRLCTTSITAFELWAGASKPLEIATVDTLLSALSIVSLDASGARRAGEVRRELDRKGAAIGMADSLIAGICLQHDAILLTRNRKHYARVSRLKLSSHSS